MLSCRSVCRREINRHPIVQMKIIIENAKIKINKHQFWNIIFILVALIYFPIFYTKIEKKSSPANFPFFVSQFDSLAYTQVPLVFFVLRKKVYYSTKLSTFK